MKRYLSLILVVSLLILGFPSLSLAKDDETSVSKKEAISAALYQVVFDQKTNDSSPWKGKNIKVKSTVEVYDTSEEITSYIVNLEYAGQPIGFVEIGNNKYDYPVLSFGYKSNRMDESNMNQINQKSEEEKANKQKVVLLAPGKFGLKSERSDGSAVITSNDNEKIVLDKEKNKPTPKKQKSVDEGSKKVWGKIDQLTAGEIGSDSDGVTDDLSFESGWTSASGLSYGSVGDANQYTSSLWTGLSGCSPGMVTYAKNHGYSSASATNHTSPSWSTVKSDLANAPSVITFTNQTYYSPNGGHTVTGVGYMEYFYNGSSSGHQYIYIHDNWDSTPELVYLAYGRNYSTLYSVKFSI